MPTLALSQADFLRGNAPESVVFGNHEDGTVDRAILVQGDEDTLDLYIYVKDNKDHDPSRKPTQVKKAIAQLFIDRFESHSEGSFVLTFGCSGCSNDVETTLKFIHRKQNIFVAGLTLDWDTRDSFGSCDVNLLAGKRIITHGVDQQKRETTYVKGHPVMLKDWSEDFVGRLCAARVFR